MRGVRRLPVDDPMNLLTRKPVDTDSPVENSEEEPEILSVESVKEPEDRASRSGRTGRYAYTDADAERDEEDTETAERDEESTQRDAENAESCTPTGSGTRAGSGTTRSFAIGSDPTENNPTKSITKCITTRNSTRNSTRNAPHNDAFRTQNRVQLRCPRFSFQTVASRLVLANKFRP